ncbi:hypothetical protein BaRGS_00006060 [Batillaria attramentaria]|uniref:BZIP domain-containing protein n=1 Tax=Batillaria attramentaria TaxID=370345 RepID=A0ABD0LTE2_9CAEN
MFPTQETTYADSKYVAGILSSMASGSATTQSHIGGRLSHTRDTLLCTFAGRGHDSVDDSVVSPFYTSCMHRGRWKPGNMMDYTYHHQYNMYPEYYTPQYAQQYPPYPVPNFLTTMTSGTGTTPTLTPTTLANLEQTFIELQSVPVNGSAANGGCDPHTQSGFVPPIVDPSSREQSQDSFEESDPEWEPSYKRARGENGIITNGDHSQSSAPQRKYTRRNRNEKLSPEEEERRRVRRERNKLAAAKCRQRRVDHTNTLVEETEKLEAEKSDLENEIHTLQQQKDQLEFILQAHVPICKVDPSGSAFKVKSEPVESAVPLTSSSLRTACSSSVSSSASSSNSSSRPNSLPLDRQRNGELPVVVSCATGVPISTPSSGLFTYTSLDSLVEGSTGLTPLTAGPGIGVSCASQVHRSESESGSEAVGSPTLISL